MPQPKKLIEVAMPIKEISAESVRDKSIRHGHISTLHLWWARRPLPVCRAVVFASLVPDPLDENCPQAFRDAVNLLLGKDAHEYDYYAPYKDIPWTPVYDPMEDNLRNRLQMFIGKFTDEMQEHLLKHKPKPAAGKQLADSSLIKWDNKNNENIINTARKLIWMAHNSSRAHHRGKSAADYLKDFDKHYTAIKQAEEKLYSLPNRHIETQESKRLTEELYRSIESFLDGMPKVFDPFAGGGAIPLEAARLGCRSFGNDINPVAHIIQKGSLEFPQKYGKPINYTKQEFIRLYGEDAYKSYKKTNPMSFTGKGDMVHIENRLSFDVEFYAKKLLAEAEKEIGKYYPADKDGKRPIAYYWARVGTCSNPTCRAEVPLLKGFYLANTSTKQVYLKPVIKGKRIDFEIKHGKFDEEGWMTRGNMKCPVCGNTTDVKTLKEQFITGTTSERLLAVIEDGKNGKEYRQPVKEETDILEKIPEDIERPTEPMPVQYTQALPSCTWGLSTWGQMFSPRQLLALQTLVQKLNEIKASLHPEEDEYAKAVVTYLGILMDRIAVANTTFGVWHVGGEKLERIMGRQAIPMVFDYPESNPFCNSSGSALNQLEWLTRYIEGEGGYPFNTLLKNASSGERNQFENKYLTAVVTDPPYYDAIAYADLSDFFYVWLKRTLSDVYPLNFATPQTPKSEECTALKHHHSGNLSKAKHHFEDKLLDIFEAIELQTSDIVSIMFAHQSTEAWTTLCNSILGARMNITGSWATDTEMTGALKTDKSFLSSSVTVACKPAQREGIGNYRDVKKDIEHTVEQEVEHLYSLGFRGADLLTACFGKSVSVFGRYQTVEKADGSEVTVAELLEMAREAAFNTLLKGFDGDDPTKFYIGWLQLFGFAESDFDDAAKFAKVGLTINVQDLFKEHILIKNGNKQTLASFQERNKLVKGLGERTHNLLIDEVHKGMALYQGANRQALLNFLSVTAENADRNFWRVLTSLCEVLPQGSEDYKVATGLLSNKESLIREAKEIKAAGGQKATQTKLFE